LRVVCSPTRRSSDLGVLTQQRNIRAAHNAQVDGPQPNHGQNTGEEAINLALGVQKSRDNASDESSNKADAGSKERVDSVGNEHTSGSRAGGKAAVDGQVRKI